MEPIEALLERIDRQFCGCDSDDGYQCREHCTACYSKPYGGKFEGPCGWHKEPDRRLFKGVGG